MSQKPTSNVVYIGGLWRESTCIGELWSELHFCGWTVNRVYFYGPDSSIEELQGVYVYSIRCNCCNLETSLFL